MLGRLRLGTECQLELAEFLGRDVGDGGEPQPAPAPFGKREAIFE